MIVSDNAQCVCLCDRRSLLIYCNKLNISHRGRKLANAEEREKQKKMVDLFTACSEFLMIFLTYPEHGQFPAVWRVLLVGTVIDELVFHKIELQRVHGPFKLVVGTTGLLVS